MLRALSFAISILLTQGVFADEAEVCGRYKAAFPTGTVCKEARPNDRAEAYLLLRNKDFFRVFTAERGRIVKCQITNAVEDFKVSSHSDDAAMIYYRRDGDLYVLNNGSGFDGDCPSQVKKKIMDDVEKYNVVSNASRSDDSNQVIVNMALSRQGRFVAWFNSDVAARLSGIQSYQMNNCYGSRGKNFSNFVAFAEGNYGVYAVRENGKVNEYENSTIESFKRSQNVCQ